MIKIIDHKRVEMTADEHKMYQNICRSYDRANFKGESLFEGHFETSEGIIIFVKPPQKKYSSLEVYCFLISLMVNQHLRLMHQQVEALVAETKKSVAEHLSSKEKTDEPEEISDKEDKKPVEDKPQSSVKKSKPSPKKRRRV